MYSVECFWTTLVLFAGWTVLHLLAAVGRMRWSGHLIYAFYLFDVIGMTVLYARHGLDLEGGWRYFLPLHTRQIFMTLLLTGNMLRSGGTPKSPRINAILLGGAIALFVVGLVANGMLLAVG